jgi:insertion element IS1 protein InsB
LNICSKSGGIFSSAFLFLIAKINKKMVKSHKTVVSCFKLGVTIICIYCGADNVIKSGKYPNERQRYLCKHCKRRFLNQYQNKAYQTDMNQQIIQFTKEGVGIRSTSRILKISATTLLKRIIVIANSIPNPPIVKCQSYEVDEMRTFVKKKSRLIWIVYALERSTKSVVSFNVGARTNKTLNVVLKTLQFSEAKRIYTDKLPSYKMLISKPIHHTSIRGTNHIERKNLTLRTHLKRLNRRTICFSRSVAILTACLRIYFWGRASAT